MVQDFVHVLEYLWMAGHAPHPDRPEERENWVLNRAEAKIKLRSLKVSGDLKDYMEFHFRQERQRNYPGPPIPEALNEAA